MFSWANCFGNIAASALKSCIYKKKFNQKFKKMAKNWLNIHNQLVIALNTGDSSLRDFYIITLVITLHWFFLISHMTEKNEEEGLDFSF